ncbi:nucleic acid-binding protein [Halorubrum sp. CBA1125]|nr:nucleic acid-binding protein [Halorubrum sp. CBA1125]
MTDRNGEATENVDATEDDADAEDDPRTAGYDEWLDAIEAGDGYALVCPSGHGSLPPRRVCPECGSTTLAREPLSDAGTVETFTVVHVPSPQFADDAPYVTAVVDAGPTRVTGVVRSDDRGGRNG